MADKKSKQIRITAADVLLLAAAKIKARPFPAEDLTVTAWTLDKERFGLPGFEDHYPHHNKVLVALMGKRGLVARGRLIQVGRGVGRKYNVRGEGQDAKQDGGMAT